MKCKSSLALFSLTFIYGFFVVKCTSVPLTQEKKLGDKSLSGFVPLFNGEDLAGWEGNLEYFRVENGVIIAGTLEKPIPRNEFLCTTRDYSNFELRK